MPTVEFQRTFDDLLAFGLFFHDRRLNRNMRWYGPAVAVVILGGAAAWHYQSTGAPVVLVGYAIGTLACILLVPKLYRVCIRYLIASSIRAIYPHTPSTHRLTITDRGIEEISSEGDTFVSWNGIPEVARTDRYIFVFTGPAMSHIIPISAFPTPADAEAFMGVLLKRKG